MINFEPHCLSLKVSWLKRLYEADVNRSWYHIPAFYLRNTSILDTISYMSSHEITKRLLLKIYHLSRNRLLRPIFNVMNPTLPKETDM